MILKRQPIETVDEFIIRFMNDSNMVLEYPDFKDRYEICIANSQKKPKRKRI
jgi:hypothetical protein